MGLLKTEDEPEIEACAIARDIQSFDLLIEDMETEMQDRWGGLNFTDGLDYLNSPDAAALRFVTVAVDQEDETDLSIVSELIGAAKSNNVKVILVAHDLSPMALHQLLRQGADDFAPYPLPEGTLHDAITRIEQAEQQAQFQNTIQLASGTGSRDGVILPVHGLAGGVGGTTLTINLAWELANLCDGSDLRVCLLDFDLQFGSVSTYLDLPRREAIFELLSDTETMDNESFSQAMVSFGEKLDVLTAPAEALPLEIISPEDMTRLLDKASGLYDFVLIDMPHTLVQWSETILQRAHVYFAMMEMDMRSAQNTLRFIRALKSEELPYEKVRYVLNRAPKFTDMQGKARVKRLAENLDIEIEVQLPDGGKPVVNSCDHGLPLAETVPKLPLRKDILKLATSIFELNIEQVAVN